MIIHLSGDYETREIWLNGKFLSPTNSQKVRNHSPDGFSWGYSGSGCSQLALAICLCLYASDEGYQDFKFKYISSLPQADFDIELEVPDKLT